MSTNIAAFIVVLGVLIFFHELGHFLVAKFFALIVQKFMKKGNSRVVVFLLFLRILKETR